MTPQEASAFAHDWVASWNAHDLDRIMEHYADELDFRSPIIQQLGADPTGVIRLKTELRAYFADALGRYPTLRFELEQVLPGVDSLVLYYQSINQLQAAEYMELDPAGRVRGVRAHYTRATPPSAN
ncbi:nuclear transport factor 2 family protein [Hymenobacter sp. BT664]|uniref:Nuclear transport factor 2 family protein n=1 Tax=Hymenobacter montanus TaxID=2771359 RepID=A0A927GIG7_9BACT|nr:nuclear transport factor 2 family protein [Hymenobacter montanus]MBD2767423.1 nuclear transport factor 2 family protein [Hymenobacter montanus]